MTFMFAIGEMGRLATRALRGCDVPRFKTGSFKGAAALLLGLSASPAGAAQECSADLVGSWVGGYQSAGEAFTFIRLETSCEAGSVRGRAEVFENILAGERNLEVRAAAREGVRTLLIARA